MIIFKQVEPLNTYLQKEKQDRRTVGFVPTMGALHPGHLALIEASKKENDITVCSIFVNPTQFNNPEDFKHYPITIEKDIEQLIKSRCEVLFCPDVNEIYPSDHKKKHYALGDIETILEGFYRPGHFQGVCEVVDRLLEIVQPHNLYMGQKDIQQCMVVKKLLQLMGKEHLIELKIVPTVRESDGLAMSSRNLRLTREQRKLSTALYQALSFVKSGLHTTTFNELKRHAKDSLEQKGFQVDYLEIAETATLKTVDKNKAGLVAIIAATIGNVRLIDNLLLD